MLSLRVDCLETQTFAALENVIKLIWLSAGPGFNVIRTALQTLE